LAGLDPAIHVFPLSTTGKDVDPRVKPAGEDKESALRCKGTPGKRTSG
jgi:hypothetical protein